MRQHIQRTDCPCFPCHDGVPREKFNCLHCYCPLYFADECGGDYTYTEDGLKDCTPCTKPHEEGGHEWVKKRILELT